MSYLPRWRIPNYSASGRPSTQTSNVNAQGVGAGSFQGSSTESLRSNASVINLLSSDDSSFGNSQADVSMMSARRSSIGPFSSNIAMDETFFFESDRRSHIDSIPPSASSSSSSSSFLPQQDRPRTASGVELPVPIPLTDLPTIELWSRRVNKKMISIFELSELVGTVDKAVRFLLEQRILYDYDPITRNRANIVCVNGYPMTFTYNQGRGYVWRCHKYDCCNKSRCSALVHSFFAERKLPLHHQLIILYLWLNGAPRKTICDITDTSRPTVKGILDGFCQVMQHDFLNSQHEELDENEEDDSIIDMETIAPEERHTYNNENKIGGYTPDGESIIVEIDESKFGKRKYNNGHRVEGVWVIGGVERTNKRKLFLVTVPNRNSETIARFIRRYVNRGSTIYTDFWRGYLCISDLGRNFTHQRVNHEEGYVSMDGTCTNTIEGTWNGIKIRCFPRQRTKRNMPWVLLQFIWRRKYHGDLFSGLLKTLRDVEYDRRTVQGAFITQVVFEGEDNLRGPSSTDSDTSDSSSSDSSSSESESDFEEDLNYDNGSRINIEGDNRVAPRSQPFQFLRRSRRIANRSSSS